jgi:signal transduction histidine kinase/AmiR/NasT family two-component response regulator
MCDPNTAGSFRRFSPTYSIATILVGAVLTLYVAFLLLANYWSASNLRNVMEEQRRLESGRRVAALEYFFSERRDDLANLSLSMELAGFYGNRALGMSMRYGLSQSLVPIRARFRQLIERKRIAEEAIYQRLVLLDETGAVLVDEGGGPPRTWQELLAPDDREARILVLDDGRTLGFSLAHYFKGVYSGQLLAFLDASLPERRIATPDAVGDATCLARIEGDLLAGLGCTLAPALLRLPTHGDFTQGAPVDFRAGPGGDGERMVALIRAIPDSGLVLIDVTSSTRAYGRLAPWHLFLGMAALAVVVLLGVFLIVRLNFRAIALRAHLRESGLRERAVQEKNLELEQEIRERLDVESMLRESKEAAEAANRAKSEFLANMSHELRTPMGLVVGMTNLLLDSRLDREQTDSLLVIRHSAGALLDVIDDILDFSKVEAGQLHLEEIDFSLRDLLEELVDMFAVKAEERGLQLACIAQRGVPDRMHTDPGRLRQVLINLIGNAIKFTDQGEVEIRVCPADGDAASRRVRFLIRDTGIGIPADRQGLLFRSFSQLDRSFSRRYGGTGLGLAISRRLVELMGGEIGVESREREGARFWLELPALADPWPEEARILPLAQPRVLAMDSLDIGREALTETLAHEGIATAPVADLTGAMDALLAAEDRDAPFERILVVLRERGGEGDRLLELIRTQPWRQPPRIFALVSQSRRRDPVLSWSPAEGPPLEILVLPVHRMTLLEAMGLRTLDKPDPDTDTPERRRGSGAAILLVEDNKLNQKVAMAMLAKLGYRVEAVENGVQAIAAVGRTPYDLVLMDVQMPEMDGLEATRRIRAAEQAGALKGRAGTGRLPIVAMTAHALESDRRLCLEAGMDDVITKPVRRAEVLRETLERVMVAMRDNAD